MSYSILRGLLKPITKISKATADKINTRAEYAQRHGWCVLDKREFWEEDLESCKTTGWPSTVFWELQIAQNCNYDCAHCLHDSNTKYDKNQLTIDTKLAEERGKLTNKILKAYTKRFNVKHTSLCVLGGEVTLLPVERVISYLRLATEGLQNVFEIGITTNLSAPIQWYEKLIEAFPNVFIVASFHDSIVKDYVKFFSKAIVLNTKLKTRPVRIHTTVSKENQKHVPGIYEYVLEYGMIPTFVPLRLNKQTFESNLTEGYFIFDNLQAYDEPGFAFKNSRGPKDIASALRASSKCFNQKAQKSLWFNGTSLCVGSTACEDPKYWNEINDFNIEDFLKAMANIPKCSKQRCMACKQSVVYYE